MDTMWSDPLPQTEGPKYKRVSDTIRNAIQAGELAAGSKLPPVRDLAFQLGITPGTVARAYTVLTDEGVLTAEVGRGTFVAEPAGPLTEDIGAQIEIDVIAHNSPHLTQNEVNLYSPHLPVAGQTTLIKSLLADLSRSLPSGLMHYPSQSAARPVREAVVGWLSGLPLGSISEQQVVLSNGGQQAISLFLQSNLRGRRPVVLVEELAYPGFRRAAELLRAEVVPVAMDQHGLCPDALEAAARSHDAQVLFTTPDIHNPTALFTPVERRVEIAEIARRHDMQIFEDACYLVRESSAPSYRMLAPERAWFATSLSKSITPALRVGFTVGPKERATLMRRAAEYSFFGVSSILTDLTAALLTHPKLPVIEQEVRRITNTYLQSAVNILGMYQLGWHVDAPFIWLTLPSGWRAGAFCQAAESQGIRVRPAEDYTSRNARSPHAVRMAVNAGVSLDRFEDAMQRLRDLLDNPHNQIGV